MLTILEHVAVGAALIAAAAIGLARAAVYFRRTESKSNGDRFFSTSLTSVVLVALAVAGAFYIGRAAFEVDGVWRVAVAVAGLVYTALVPFAMWRLFGPRPEALAT